VILPQTADAGVAYQDKLVFVGDSLTAHLASRGVLSGGTNTTQVWRTTTNMLNLNSEITSARIVLPGSGESVTIAQAAAQVKPAILIITLGTDWGVAYLNETDFKACYGELVRAVQEASPSTTVILQSIFPVTADCKVLTNEKIDQANTWVLAVAAETGCRYLDTQSVLKDENNCLKDEYCASTDGIHLTAEAYQVVLSYIRTHAAS
jgi:lysophospholipase L1-like esterase